MTPAEREELSALRREVELCSMGDRPHSPAAATLRRLWELRELEINEMEVMERDDAQQRRGVDP
jgi:hypothetical protein